MPIAKLEYNLSDPEDRDAFRTATQADDWRGIVRWIDERLKRAEEETDSVLLNDIRDEMFREIDGECLRLYD
jgi:hypothetical protein